MLAVLSETKGFQNGHKLQFGEYEHKRLDWHVLTVNKKEKSVLIIADSYCGIFEGYKHWKVTLLADMDQFAMQVFTDDELEFICKKEEHYACLLSWDEICKYMTDKVFLPHKETNKGVRWWHIYIHDMLGYVEPDGLNHGISDDYKCTCRMRPALWVKYDGLPANNNENTDKNKKKK